MKDKLSREELYSPLKSKGFLHEWARDIMDTFPVINEIITESKLRELGVQLLMKQKNSEAIMTVKKFDSLKSRDFENGAVINEIRSALKERESLLTPVPEEKIKSEPGGLKPGEYMHEWLEQDAVEFDLPTEEIIGALARDNKLLKDKLDAIQKPIPEERLDKFVENLTNRMEQMFMQKTRRKDREFFIKHEVIQAYDNLREGKEG